MHTSSGAASTLTVTTIYASDGTLQAGTVKTGELDLAGVVTVTNLALTYNPTASAWTGTPALAGSTARRP